MSERISIICPHCKFSHKYEKDEAADLPGEKFICQGCGRRLRIETEGGTMHCNNCDARAECEDCVDTIKARIVCYRHEMHSWQKTLATDIEKCSNCNDIRRVPPSANAPAAS